MNISLRQIRAFIVVARFSSFTRAADLLHLTQPALTVQIRQLEQALGVKLFDRNTRAVELTRIGRELLPVLERLLGEFDAVVVSTREMATLRYGNPDKGFSGCGFELIAGLQVELGLERVDLVGGDGRDDVDEGVDDGSMLGQIEG